MLYWKCFYFFWNDIIHCCIGVQLALIKRKNNCQKLRRFKMDHQVCFFCFTTDILNLNFKLQLYCNLHVQMSEFNLKISLQNYKSLSQKSF